MLAGIFIALATERGFAIGAGGGGGGGGGSTELAGPGISIVSQYQAAYQRATGNLPGPGNVFSFQPDNGAFYNILQDYAYELTIIAGYRKQLQALDALLDNPLAACASGSFQACYAATIGRNQTVASAEATLIALQNARKIADGLKSKALEIHPDAHFSTIFLKKLFPTFVFDPSTFNTPAFNATTLSTGIDATLDLSNYFKLPLEQDLTAMLSLGGAESRFSQSAPPGGVPVSGHSDTFNSSFGLNYLVDENYVRGTMGIFSGRVSESSAVGSGSFTAQGYSLDGAVGHYFSLWNGMTSENLRRTGGTFANQWTSVMLDLRAHLGYGESWASQLADSSGFTVSSGDMHYGLTGVYARLFATYRYENSGYIEPYIEVGYDYYFDFKNLAFMPAQGALPATELLFANSPLNAESVGAGVSFHSDSGMKVTASGFYAVFDGGYSTGGSLSLTVPFTFGLPPAPASQQSLTSALPPIVTKTR